jgi:hypothetical protein
LRLEHRALDQSAQAVPTHCHTAREVRGQLSGDAADRGDHALVVICKHALAEQERFGFFHFASKSPLQDIFVNLKVTLTGAPAGDYKIRFMVHNANSEKTAALVQPIKLK